MWHSLDWLWDSFHSTPQVVFMTIETLVMFAGMGLVWTSVTRRCRGPRRFLVTWWPIPVCVGLAAIYIAVSHGVWTSSQPEFKLIHDWIFHDNPNLTFGAICVAFSSLLIFIVKWGWMTEENHS